VRSSRADSRDAEGLLVTVRASVPVDAPRTDPRRSIGRIGVPVQDGIDAAFIFTCYVLGRHRRARRSRRRRRRYLAAPRREGKRIVSTFSRAGAPRCHPLSAEEPQRPARTGRARVSESEWCERVRRRGGGGGASATTTGRASVTATSSGLFFSLCDISTRVLGGLLRHYGIIQSDERRSGGFQDKTHPLGSFRAGSLFPQREDASLGSSYTS